MVFLVVEVVLVLGAVDVVLVGAVDVVLVGAVDVVLVLGRVDVVDDQFSVNLRREILVIIIYMKDVKF